MWIFLTQLAIKWPFSFFLPHLVSVSALPRERKPGEICVEICKKTSQHCL